MTSDTWQRRRRLKEIHDQLRDRGLNPLEAVPLAIQEVVDGNNRLRPEFADTPRSELISDLVQEFLISDARFGLGQYLTPYPVADFLAHVTTRQLERKISVLDPFCGSGLLLERVAATAKVDKLVGIELNSTMTQVAELLSGVAELDAEIMQGDAFEMYLDGRVGEFDLVLANPPFGATATIIDAQDSRLPTEFQGQSQIPSEILGLEVCVSALKAGGTLGVVLPFSVLSNKSWSTFRQHLFRHLEVVFTVSLPSSTFGPFKGVANSCVIVGKKVSSRRIFSTPHWESKEIGYDGTGRIRGDCDLPYIAKAIDAGESGDRTLSIDEVGNSILRRTRVQTSAFRLGEIATIFRGRNPSKRDLSEQGVFILRVGDLAGSFLSWRDRGKGKLLNEKFSRYSNVILAPGDICMTGAAHHARYIGLKVDLVTEVPPPGAIPSGEVVVVRPKDGCPFKPEQILLYLRSSDGYQQIQDAVRGSTGHLYPEDLMDIEIPDLDLLFKDLDLVEEFQKLNSLFQKFRRYEQKFLSRLQESWDLPIETNEDGEDA